MSRRTMLFVALALAASALFVRLGLWQLTRLGERRARNAVVVASQASAPVPVADLPRDSTAVHYRPASVRGRFDYAHELVVANRSHRGSPGVELLTPVRIAGRDTAVLVLRGWAYSPDGATVDAARWREGDSAHVSGYVELFAPDAGVTSPELVTRVPVQGRVRHVSRHEVAARLPYPVAPFYLVSLDSAGPAHPVRRDRPAPDDGPHRGYAFQWFSFAAIALGGAAAVVRRERRERDRPE